MGNQTRWAFARRAGVVGLGGVVAVVALAGPALAHVVITPSSAPAGSAAELTFRVPDEEARAATVELQVKVPTSHPIAQLLIKPVPGWTATGQFQDFSVSTDPLRSARRAVRRSGGS